MLLGGQSWPRTPFKSSRNRTPENVVDENGLMIINKSGVMIRMNVESMRVMGRATQGVKLINLKDSDQISSVAKVEIDHRKNTSKNFIQTFLQS